MECGLRAGGGGPWAARWRRTGSPGGFGWFVAPADKVSGKLWTGNESAQVIAGASRPELVGVRDWAEVGLRFRAELSTFDEEIRSLVTDTAPRVFAVVQVYGEREDGRVAAWGFAHDEGEGGEVFDVVGVEGNVRLRVGSARAVLRA
jgi:hypothetical protein